MYKCYAVTGTNVAAGVLDTYLERSKQARRIRRFCETNNLKLSGNSILSNTNQELCKAINLWELGWIDLVVVVSRNTVEGSEDSMVSGWITALEERNALIILDEYRII